MAQFLLIYHGGSKPAPEDIPKVMKAWEDWYSELGAAVIDAGKPVGLSKTIHSNGEVTNDGGSNPCSGYTVLEASSEQEAIEMAKKNPILESGASIEVAETFDV